LLLVFGSASLLVAATARSRALAKRQMEFVAGVSHELRTPLSVIQSAGFSRVADADRIRQYGVAIQREGRRLAEMVEQMLAYAGIQSGRRQYDFQPARIEDLVERALAEYETQFTEAGWQVEKEIEAGLPRVEADARSLESAIKNLLHNALKYAAGGKWLRISVRNASDQILLTVADRGPGIDAADLRGIFEPFYRGRGVLASATSGSGLGLSIARRHVAAHGGRISVHTAPGKGAAFTLHLPALERTTYDETA
jgi:signal transduction histidine kinase